MGIQAGPIRSAAAAVLLAGLIAAPAAAQSFVLRGTIRDFKKDHPDFGPGIATGHYPGSIAFTAGADGKPMFTGGGYEAVSQWRDQLGQPIAPHLWNEGRVFVEVASAPTITSGTTQDSFDSELGPYDPATAGPGPDWLSGQPMPVIEEPTMSVAYSGDYIKSGTGTTVLSTDLHCGTFSVRDFHTVQVQGNLTVLVENNFIMRDDARLDLAPGATISFYIKGTMEVADSVVGGVQHTHRVKFYNLGTSAFRIGDESEVSAHYYGPSGALTLEDASHFYGRVTASTVNLHTASGLHIDDNRNQCGIKIEDQRGVAGSGGGWITSSETFAQWFNDMLGVNGSRAHTMVMRDSGGLYQHSDDAFFPIDGKLYGNEGDPHNYYFTFEATATFTYDACKNQYIRFEGSDDCWIFINDQLVIDLGGVEAGTPQYFELDRLRLVDGETYSFRLYYAHRHAGPARFGLVTSFELMPDPLPSGIAGYPAHD
jgi:fibro-slime domain-containing protein